MLNIITWLWRQPGYRSKFTTEHVNILAAMIRRHCSLKHRVCCVTDIPHGLDGSVKWIRAWNDFAEVRSPYGAHQPSCYRRLRAFHPEIGKVFGERFVMLDLDTVIVGDVTPLWDRPEDIVFWGETDPRSYYNGSMMLMTAGARPQVWTRFNARISPKAAKEAGRFGSDQGWLSFVLGKGEATWTKADGVYSWRVHLRPRNYVLPSDARIVMFHGGTDPDSPRAQQFDWVREHYRKDVVEAVAS